MSIIWALSETESLRYNALKRQLYGVTNIMLTRCLTELADFGLVERRERSQIPPHVEYSLTPLGQALVPSLRMLVDWGTVWKQDAIAKGRKPPEEEHPME